MTIERTLDKFYYLTGDEKSTVGNCNPVDHSIRWDFFNDKDESFHLKEAMTFQIREGRFSGSIGDYQNNSCNFLLFSNKLRNIVEKYLTDEDQPIWYPAKVIDLDAQEHNYSILYFFARPDLLNYETSTFVIGTDHPIKKRYNLNKIDSRLIFSTIHSSALCVHDIVKKAKCTGTYFYKIHRAGRLS